MAEHPTTVLRPELGLGPNVRYVGMPTDPGEPTTATTVSSREGMMDLTLPNEHIRWGVVVVTYLFLSGIGTGSLIIAVLPRLPGVFEQPTLLRLRRAAIISAAACFVVIPLAVIADLTQPWRMWRVLFAPHLTSAMPYGSVVLIVLTVLIALNLWLIHRQGFARVAAERERSWSGRVAGCPRRGSEDPDESAARRARAVVAGAGGRVGRRRDRVRRLHRVPAQQHDLVRALVHAAARDRSSPSPRSPPASLWLSLLTGLSREFSGDGRMLRLLAGSAAALLGGHLGVRLWSLAHSAYGENTLWPAIRELHFSRDAFAFVGLELLLGGVVAVALLIVGAVRSDRRLAVAGGLLGLVGLYASRWMIVIGGQTISRSGRGFVDEAVHIGGREGVLASSGLVIWALVVGYALWLVLPHDVAPAATRDLQSTTRRHVLAIGAGAVAAIAAGWSTIRALFQPDFTAQAVGSVPAIGRRGGAHRLPVLRCPLRFPGDHPRRQGPQPCSATPTTRRRR
ncbi:MAG: NrfD/PsrC family molybdoenzyme membrane anchor subunit [Acidimicrobiia bacterium]|nr:NrfD/PsrC family molybdoenzyme membrane anchor subunit [Acidimicrobiia bacterium]